MNKIPQKTYDIEVGKNGRVGLPKDLRDKYGNDYRLVRFDSHLELIPTDEAQIKEEWLELDYLPLIFEFKIPEGAHRGLFPKKLREEFGKSYRVVEDDGSLVSYPLEGNK